jgi:hypothetical protein
LLPAGHLLLLLGCQFDLVLDRAHLHEDVGLGLSGSSECCQLRYLLLSLYHRRRNNERASIYLWQRRLQVPCGRYL